MVFDEIKQDIYGDDSSSPKLSPAGDCASNLFEKDNKFVHQIFSCDFDLSRPKLGHDWPIASASALHWGRELQQYTRVRYCDIGLKTFSVAGCQAVRDLWSVGLDRRHQTRPQDQSGPDHVVVPADLALQPNA